MTAIPHDGASGRGVRSSANAVRSRVLRAGSAPKSRSRSVSPSQPPTAGVNSSTAESVAGGTVAAPSVFGLNVGSLNPTAGVGSLRLVISGRRVRLGNGAFLVLVLGLLSGILITLLMLNTALAENSFQLTDIRQKERDLIVREQTLANQLAAAESPIGLERLAKDMGMVPAGSPVFLRLSDGKVLGESTPAQALPAAKPKKPKQPKNTDPFAGEFPAGQSPALPTTVVPGLPTSGGTVVGGETPIGSVIEGPATQSGSQQSTQNQTLGGEMVAGEVPGGVSR